MIWSLFAEDYSTPKAAAAVVVAFDAMGKKFSDSCLNVLKVEVRKTCRLLKLTNVQIQDAHALIAGKLSS